MDGREHEEAAVLSGRVQARGSGGGAWRAAELGLLDWLLRSWLRWDERGGTAVSVPARRVGPSPVNQAAEIARLRHSSSTFSRRLFVIADGDRRLLQGPPRPIRPKWTGLDQQDAEAERRDLARQRLRKAFDGKFRRRIVARARKADDPPDGSDVDDRSVVSCLHAGQDRTGHCGQTEDIGLEQGWMSASSTSSTAAKQP